MSGEFRDAVRSWLADNVPGDEELETAKRFQAALCDAGLAGLTWPEEYGGRGLSADEQQIFDQEAARYDLPTSVFRIGMGMCGPTILDLGTHEQKSRHIPPLLRGEEIWCQLFSEPGAGSDVASLQTRAVRDGDEWVINGQKVWTTVAHLADFGALLARTDPDVPKHQGLTMFLIDMHDPAVTVRPLKDMTGRAPFNEVYFENLRLPADAVLGQVGQGWLAAVTMLGHERVSIGGFVRKRRDPLAHANLAETARRYGRDRDPVVRAELAKLYAAERALALFNTRLRQEAEAGSPPGARGSVAKLAGALLGQQAVGVASTIGGPRVAAWDPDDPAGAELALAINQIPSSSIAGGTDQIQRNIIGDRILGLPREPVVDRDVPFRDLRVGTQRTA